MQQSKSQQSAASVPANKEREHSPVPTPSSHQHRHDARRRAAAALREPASDGTLPVVAHAVRNAVLHHATAAGGGPLRWTGRRCNTTANHHRLDHGRIHPHARARAGSRSLLDDQHGCVTSQPTHVQAGVLSCCRRQNNISHTTTTIATAAASRIAQHHHPHDTSPSGWGTTPSGMSSVKFSVERCS